MAKKKAKKRVREAALDKEYGKKQNLLIFHTAVGPMMVGAEERIAVREGDNRTTLPARRVTPDMHVITWKQVLSHLTLQDIHNDLMSSNDKHSARYRDSHKQLHVNFEGARQGSPVEAEIPLLRSLLLRHFNPEFSENKFIPAEIKGKNKFEQKLFNIDGQDFSVKTYIAMNKYIHDAAGSGAPQWDTLRGWLRGEVRMPKRLLKLHNVGEALSDPEIHKFIELKDVGRFWGGRRSSLMAYIAGMKAVGTGEAKEWKPAKSQLTELNTILAKRIKEIQKNTVSVGIHNITEMVARPGEVKEKEPRIAKLSKSLLRPKSESTKDFQKELEELGFDTSDLEVTTHEEELQKELDAMMLQKEPKKKTPKEEPEPKPKIDTEAIERAKKAKEEKERLDHEEHLRQQEIVDKRAKNIFKLFFTSGELTKNFTDITSAITRVVDFLSNHGPDRKQFEKDFDIEENLLLDALDNQIIVRDKEHFSREMRARNHSIVKLFDKIYDGHPEIKKEMGNREKFVSQMLRPIYLNTQKKVSMYNRATKKKSGNRKLKKQNEIKDELRQDNVMCRKESLELFDALLQRHPDEIKETNELGNQLPPILLPMSVIRQYDKAGKTKGLTPWSDKNMKIYMRLAKGIGHEMDFEMRNISDKPEDRVLT